MILLIFALMNFLQNNLLTIFDSYQRPEPLSLFLKNYFSQNKKLGSRDRKAIREACYMYFRWRPYFAKDTQPLAIIKWCIEQSHIEIPYLIKMMEDIPQSNLNYLIPEWPELSKNLDLDNYINTLQNLPNLFIRVQPDKKFDVIKKLKDHQIDVKLMDALGYNFVILKLPNGCPIQDILIDSDYVVHDYASQLSLLKSLKNIDSKINTIWDICSGAGGKTILSHLILHPSQMYCFDIRPQILLNLRQRTDKQRLNNIKTITHDWAKQPFIDTKGLFPDLFICDVPCSGSGTWGRTPEQIGDYNDINLEEITTVQAQILSNVSKIAVPNQYILYITCSVFKEENEVQIEKFSNKCNVEIITEELIDGTLYNSDSMYYCLMKVSK